MGKRNFIENVIISDLLNFILKVLYQSDKLCYFHFLDQKLPLNVKFSIEILGLVLAYLRICT